MKSLPKEWSIFSMKELSNLIVKNKNNANIVLEILLERDNTNETFSLILRKFRFQILLHFVCCWLREYETQRFFQ